MQCMPVVMLCLYFTMANFTCNIKLSSTTSKTVRNVLSAVLAFVTVYAYMTHTRGVVLIIAAFMTVVLISAVYKHKTVNYFIYVPVSGVLMVIDKFWPLSLKMAFMEFMVQDMVVLM